jgi:hypothetical protein
MLSYLLCKMYKVEGKQKKNEKEQKKESQAERN